MTTWKALVSIWGVMGALSCTIDRPDRSPPPKPRTHDAAVAKPVEPSKRAELIAQATRFAKERGRSIEGLQTNVSDYGDSWMVWFAGPLEKGKSGGTGFAVKIPKAGDAAVSMFSFQ